MSRARLVAAVLALGLLPAACGGGGGVDAATWVRSVCSSLADWRGELDTRTGSLQDEIGGLARGDFEGLQGVMLRYIDDVISSTETTVSKLEEAGVPDVEDGREAADVIVGGIDQARSIFADARDRIADLDPGAPRAFATALQEIGTSVQEGGQEVQSALQEAGNRGLGGPELDEAFSNEPACSAVA